MDADKNAFYEKVAKGLAASTILHGVDSISKKNLLIIP